MLGLDGVADTDAMSYSGRIACEQALRNQVHTQILDWLDLGDECQQLASSLTGEWQKNQEYDDACAEVVADTDAMSYSGRIACARALRKGQRC